MDPMKLMGQMQHAGHWLDSTGLKVQLWDHIAVSFMKNTGPYTADKNNSVDKKV